MKSISLIIIFILFSFYSKAQYGGEVFSSDTCQKCITICVLNIDSLKAINTAILTPSTYIQVSGYYTKNDGGGGLFMWSPTSNRINDNGYVISPNGSPTVGRYIRMKKGVVHLKEFGAINNNATRSDNTAFTDAINYFINTQSSSTPTVDPITSADIFLDAGVYKLSIDYTYNLRLKLSGDVAAKIKPSTGATYIFKFSTNHFLAHEISGINFDGNVSFSGVPTGTESGWPSAIKIDYNSLINNMGVELRIDKCTFINTIGCDFLNCREVYISNSNFELCSKAVVLKNATEVRIDNCNFKHSGYGILADGDFTYDGVPNTSNPYHAGLYLNKSFMLGLTNFPIYCTYMDYADINNNMIDYNDKPIYFKSLTVGNIHANFLGTRISSANVNDNINSKSLVIDGGSTSNFEDRTVNINVTNNYILSHTESNLTANIDGVLIKNTSFINFSNNHVDYYNRHGLVLTECTVSKINDNYFTRNDNSTVTGGKGISSTNTVGGNNIALNNYGVDNTGVDANTKVITEQQFRDMDKSILQGGNTFNAAITMGTKDDNSVHILANNTPTLTVNKDYVYSSKNLRIGLSQFIQCLSSTSGLSSVFGLDPGNNNNLLIGDIYNQLSGYVILRGNNSDQLRVGTSVQRNISGTWYDVATDKDVAKQGGNTFGTALTIGTKDNNTVNIMSNNTTVLSASAGTSFPSTGVINLNTNTRIAQGQFLQFVYPSSVVASVAGGDNTNIYVGNIFGQLPSTGALILRGDGGNDMLKIGSSVQRNIGGSLYNVATDNFFATLTYSGSNIPVDFSNFNTASITLTKASSLTFSNARVKTKYTVVVKQDATGGRTLSFPGSSNVFTKGSIDATANAYSVLNIEFDGTNTFINITSAWTKIP